MPCTLRGFPILGLVLAGLVLSGCSGRAPVIITEAEVPPPPETADPTVSAIAAAARQDTFALDELRTLCDEVGYRLAGSEGMRQAHVWAAAAMAKAGCDTVWSEPVTVPRWERGREWARLVDPVETNLPILGLGMSDGTGPEGLEAEVIAVRDFEELEARAGEVPGKIVLFDPPWEGYGPNVQYRVHGARRAAEHGAVACLIRPAGFGQNTPHTGVMRYEDGIPRIPAASLTVEDAARLHRMCDRGLRPRVHLMMEARNLPEGSCANVVGELRGRERPEEIVLIGGHLDAWDTGGSAHDDGAGCVVMVAALKVLHDLDLVPRRTVRVVLFTSEEYGGHGGRAYRDAHAEEVARHTAALESDGGMFAPAGFSVRGSEAVLEQVRELAVPLAFIGAGEVNPGWAGVDIGPLVELGVPGIGHRTHNEDYFRYHHSPADTFDKVDPEHLADNVAAIAALVLALAESEIPLSYLSDPVPAAAADH